MANIVVRLDNMSGTKIGSLIKSAKYLVGTTATAIQNGSFVTLGALVTGNREVFEAKAPTALTSEVVLVATPELIYDETVHHNLDEFINVADKPVRTYVLSKGDIFSVTAEAFVAVPTVGQLIIPTVGATTATAVASVTTQFVIGTCIAIETVGTKTFYVIQK